MNLLKMKIGRESGSWYNKKIKVYFAKGMFSPYYNYLISIRF